MVALRAELHQLRKELEEQKGRVWELLRLNCEQLVKMDTLLSQKEENCLRHKLARLCRSSPRSVQSGISERSRRSAEDEGMPSGCS